MLYKEIFKRLKEENLKYLIVGGLAVNLHGYVRATGDLDIIILLSDENIKSFVNVAKSLGYKPRIPVELEDFIKSENRDKWIKEKNMKVFSIYNPKDEREHIDVLIDHDLDFDEAYKNKSIYNINGVDVTVISIPELIKLKEKADRIIDRNDILALNKLLRLRRNE